MELISAKKNTLTEKFLCSIDKVWAGFAIVQTEEFKATMV